jgi:arylformamidase
LAGLSHEIVAGMVTYPGIAAPQLQVTISREASAARLNSGASFEVGSLTLAGNTGTYIDSPYHYQPDRQTLRGCRLSGWSTCQWRWCGPLAERR